MEQPIILVATLGPLAISILGGVTAYGQLRQKVSNLEEVMKEMKRKSEDRQVRVYDALDKIRADIHQINVNVAKLNGK